MIRAASARRLLRPWAAAIVIAALIVVVLVVLVKENSGASQPLLVDGSGLLQFNGYSDSVAWKEDRALGVNRLFTWADLEPQDGQYNWGEFDSLLATARANRKHLAPRVYTNIGTYGQATPDWVFDAGAQPYGQENGDPRQPVPTDAIFTEKFSAFLKALGERYDGNESIEFFQTNAGMGGFGEMVWGYPADKLPPGWTPDLQVSITKLWIDRWRDAFPHTHLVLMENFIGYNVVERIAPYAVDKHFYLQVNDPEQPPESQRILTTYGRRTGIILEVEDQGCRSSTGEAYDAMIQKIFGYGFPVDYLVICGESFADGQRIEGTISRLRTHDK